MIVSMTNNCTLFTGIPTPSVPASPALVKTGTDKKRKIRHIRFQDASDDQEEENQTPIETRKRGQKRKPSHEPDRCLEDPDIEMDDATYMTTRNQTKTSPTHRSLSRSMADAASSPRPQYFVDRETSAVVGTTNTWTSPISRGIMMKDRSIQTEPIAMFDEEYVDFLKASHQGVLRAKDQELSDLRRRLTDLEKRLENTQHDLLKERERNGLEKGWKKYF